MTHAVELQLTPPAFSGIVGFGRRDITPPVGICATGGWGASTHDRADATHRPLNATALALREGAEAPPAILIAMDHTELGTLATGQQGLVPRVLRELGLPPSRLIVSCTHSHATPDLVLGRVSRPGGELLEPYLEILVHGIVEAAREAMASAALATITWATGRCDLATNRDLPDPDPGSDRIVVACNPAIEADDTVIVGRVTRESDGRVIGTIVNYACHPTTLGWDNKLVSPDFVGAMRELVEMHTGGEPCLFLQGASGELAPAYQYLADTGVADGHGKRLGYAVLSAIQGMLPPRRRLAFTDVVESGAPLGVWSSEPFSPDTTLRTSSFPVDLPLRSLPDPEELRARAEASNRHWEAERFVRLETIIRSLGEGPTHSTPAWVWRVGTSLWVGHPNEAYSALQRSLREAYPDHAVVVMNLVNDGDVVAYLAPSELHDLDLYPIWQSPFDRGSLEVLTARCLSEMGLLV